MSYSPGSSRSAERIILYLFILIAVLVWGIFGGGIFLGILQAVAGS